MMVCTVVLYLEYYTRQIHNLTLIKSILLPQIAQDPHQPSKMGPGQRRRQSWMGRDLPQGNGKMFYPHVEQQEITKYHTSCSWMLYPKDVHKSGPGGSDQVLHHVHGIFQGIQQGPRLSSSCYHPAEGGVNPPYP